MNDFNIFTTPRVIAHRGCGKLAPENSMEGVVKAIGMGVRGIEIDVHCTKDGVPFVHHNTALADGRRIMDIFSCDMPASIATLGSIVRYCNVMRVWVDVDVKFERGSKEPADAARARATRMGYAVASLMVIPPSVSFFMPPHMLSSFNSDVLVGASRATRNSNDLILALIAHQLVTNAWRNVVLPASKNRSELFNIAKWHNVWVWGDIEEQLEAAELFKLGVIGIITDRPDTL